jgi:hypothetical protein
VNEVDGGPAEPAALPELADETNEDTDVSDDDPESGEFGEHADDEDGEDVGFGVPTGVLRLRASEAISSGSIIDRSDALDGTTVLLQDGQEATWGLDMDAPDEYFVTVRYSIDDLGSPARVAIAIDGDPVDEFEAQTAGTSESGETFFRSSPSLGPYILHAGRHEVIISVVGGSDFGVEIDHVLLH